MSESPTLNLFKPSILGLNHKQLSNTLQNSMTFGYIINHHTTYILCLDSNQSPGKNNKTTKIQQGREARFFTMTSTQLVHAHENIITR